jgi:hypothetical protein
VKSSRLLSEVRFGAFLAYSPRGTSEISKNSRIVRDAIKYVRPAGLRQVVDRLTKEFPDTPLNKVLGPNVTLVPAPRSTPLVSGALWPAMRLADALVTRGLGREAVPLVRRANPVQKSAYANAGARPTPQEHLDSLAIEPLLVNPLLITVVDDVVTKGATLLAATSIVKTHFPYVDVRAFAMLRTMGLQPEVEAITAPCEGIIALTAAGEAWRSP